MPRAEAALVSPASNDLMGLVHGTFTASMRNQESLTKLGRISHGALVDELPGAMKAMEMRGMQTNSHKCQAKRQAVLQVKTIQFVARGFQAGNQDNCMVISVGRWECPARRWKPRQAAFLAWTVRQRTVKKKWRPE